MATGRITLKEFIQDEVLSMSKAGKTLKEIYDVLEQEAGERFPQCLGNHYDGLPTVR